MTDKQKYIDQIETATTAKCNLFGWGLRHIMIIYWDGMTGSTECIMATQQAVDDYLEGL